MSTPRGHTICHRRAESSHPTLATRAAVMVSFHRDTSFLMTPGCCAFHPGSQLHPGFLRRKAKCSRAAGRCTITSYCILSLIGSEGMNFLLRRKEEVPTLPVGEGSAVRQFSAIINHSHCFLTCTYRFEEGYVFVRSACQLLADTTFKRETFHTAT